MQSYSHPDVFFCPLYNRPGISDPKMNLCGSDDDSEIVNHDQQPSWGSPDSPCSSAVHFRSSRRRECPKCLSLTWISRTDVVPGHVPEQLAVACFGKEAAQVEAHERESGQVAPRIRDGSREPADCPRKAAAGESLANLSERA
ncbi:hypothetical protein L227DRAFT_422493 [Lentinus tigrinus ALCF2SS1-6]|uniref:Uncharacterized protein n=1 Tax=Lentinus tigrinus ALCF2SS1-6 TaxID=1328759 RepID=A0A5C2RNC7_9APHY|nr:hypothetical protein L227DRAFT_422493 [Lentinus tigrinus ALCF2SS1-6]